MDNLRNLVKSVVKNVLLFLAGIALLILLVLYFIAFSPIYLYRFLLSKVIAPLFGRKIVCLGASGLATDFLPQNIKYSSRNSVVVNLVLEGTVSFTGIKEKVENRWINSKQRNGNLLYPELQQCPEQWMGLMFWQQVKTFDFNEHLKLHTLPKNSDDYNSELFVRNLIEDLINRPFSLKTPPWELHVLHNYKNSDLSKEPMTMLLMRLHHCLADGPSFLTAAGDLFGASLSEMNLVPLTVRNRPKLIYNLLRSLIKIPNFITNFAKDFLFLGSKFKQQNPWLLKSDEHTGVQFVSRTKLIPVKVVKSIKQKYGTSFTAVLLSSIAAGMASWLNKEAENAMDKMLTGIPIPLRNNSKKLGIHSTATLLELPTSPSLTSLERLKLCHQLLNFAKHSTLPFIVNLLQKLLLVHYPPLARFIYLNRTFPTYVSSFPGPTAEVKWHGINKLLGADYAVAGLIGNAGVGVTVLSTMEFLRITVTAEKRIMTRMELDDMVAEIENEIVRLYGSEYNYMNFNSN